jgi:serine/threonine protein kinase
MEKTLNNVNDIGSQLINYLESLESIDNRYSNIECVNATGKEKKGFFSFIFKAFDVLEEEYVAIKFFDPNHISDQYRLASFDRESEILKSLESHKRCLQLKQAKSIHLWLVNVVGDKTINLPIPYFITEWLENDIEKFSYEQEKIEALAKLETFRDIVLAVNALHIKDVSHRDLKFDNFRLKNIAGEELVVAIDFGTSAHIDSYHITNSYKDFYPGALQYTSLEAQCGFAGDRELSFKNDIYALGCILFEMFNVEMYFFNVTKNSSFRMLIVAMRAQMSSVHGQDSNVQKEAWQAGLKPFEKSILPPTILQDGNSVPHSIKGIIEKLHAKLVKLNCFERSFDVDEVLRHVDTCIKIINNDFRQKRIIEKRRLVRENKITKLKSKEERLLNYRKIEVVK